MDPRVEKLAAVLVNYSVAVQKGDLVQIRVFDKMAEPLAVAVYKYVILAGGNAFFRMSPTDADYVFYKYASDLLDVPDSGNRVAVATTRVPVGGCMGDNARPAQFRL